MKSDIEKFLSRIKVISGKLPPEKCWEWSGFIEKKGYGSFHLSGKNIRAHRYSYEIFNGKLVSGLVIDHICINKSCVNPKHLRQVTLQVNAVENCSPNANVNKTHCKNGHKLTKDNLAKRKSNIRECRLCINYRSKLFRLKKKQNLTS